MAKRILLTMLSLLVLGVLAPLTARAQDVAWARLQLSARDDHAMAFDAARGVTVLFGGSGALGETWEWNGTRWSLRSTTGPSPRSSHAMVYDATRRVTILFGGASGSVRNGETWEWDGAVWTQRVASGPSARSGHSMAYDAARHVAVLFGGLTANNIAGLNRETWEWDGSTWNQRATAGPSARIRHRMVYDAARDITVLFGGTVGTDTFSADTWEWDGSNWTQRNVPGPSARTSCAMVFDASRGVTVLFGGSVMPGTIVNRETWEWNGTTWTHRLVNGPSNRNGHAMAYDAARGVTVLFDGDGKADTWLWNGNAWTEQQGVITTPTSLAGHATVYDAGLGAIVLFGGDNPAPNSYNGETWAWDRTNWALLTTSGPAARYRHSMVYDSARGKAVLFGGMAGSVYFGDTWEWDGTTWTQREVSGPPARFGQAMAYDVARGVTVLFGGTNINAGIYYSDTWEWDGAAWTQRLVSGPSARFGHAMAYDTARGVTVLFGGGASVYGAETWEWNGTAWTQRVVSGPSARRYHAMAYDVVRGVTVLFGGSVNIPTAPPSNEVWEWNGASWVQRLAVGPSGRSSHSLSYDARGSVCVVFSGIVDDISSVTDTWGLGAPCIGPAVSERPVDQVVCSADAASVGVGALGTGPISYQWQIEIAPGTWLDLGSDLGPVPCPGGGNGFAFATPTNSPTVSIGVQGCVGVQHYSVRCVVTNACGSARSGAAALTVLSADYNASGQVDGDDLSEYIADFFDSIGVQAGFGAPIAIPGGFAGNATGPFVGFGRACPGAVDVPQPNPWGAPTDAWRTGGYKCSLGVNGDPCAAANGDDLSDYVTVFFGGCP